MTVEPAESLALERDDLDEPPRRPGRAAAAAAGGTGVAAALLSVLLEGHERDVALAVAHALGDPLVGQWPTIAIAAAAAVAAVAYGRKSNIRWRRQLRLAQRPPGAGDRGAAPGPA